MGGTGKTPMVEYLIRLIGEKDVGVLSRGYGRSTNDFIVANKKYTPRQAWVTNVIC